MNGKCWFDSFMDGLYGSEMGEYGVIFVLERGNEVREDQYGFFFLVMGELDSPLIVCG